ncbi:MAG: nucleotide exchange factor GrpE [Candidatus Moraniibacteriota bacterium]
MQKENKKEEITMEVEKGCNTQLTIKAAVFNKERKVLLLRRADEGIKNAKKYDLPGGWLEEGESVVDTLKREIKEETGLVDISIGDLIRFAEFENENGKVSKFRGLRYIVYCNEVEVKLNPREHSDYEWLSFDEAIEKLNTGDGFEEEKMETLKEAKKYLEKETALEGWKRSLAEFENYKKMQAESQKDRIRYAAESFILQIIPVIDNFQVSTAHIPEDQKDGGWVQGIMYIQKQLEDVLRENGAEEIDLKVGDNFDTKFCEAVLDNCCSKGECEKKEKYKNKIKKVILKGYKIGEKVIRPMRVTVE